jgi:hypothetical protein
MNGAFLAGFALGCAVVVLLSLCVVLICLGGSR